MKNRLLSFKYAWQGFLDLLRHQPNVRIHILAAAVAITLGLWLRINYFEWAFIVGCISSVLVAEAFNTALEYLTDLISPQYNVLAGRAKDAAAAAVLITAAASLVIGWLVLGTKLCKIFFN